MHAHVRTCTIHITCWKKTNEKEREIVAPRSPVQSHGGLHDWRKLKRVHNKGFSHEFGIDRLRVDVCMHGSLSALGTYDALAENRLVRTKRSMHTHIHT